MSEVVWSVNILLGIGLLGVAYAIYYILKIANDETKISSHDVDHKVNHQ